MIILRLPCKVIICRHQQFLHRKLHNLFYHIRQLTGHVRCYRDIWLTPWNKVIVWYCGSVGLTDQQPLTIIVSCLLASQINFEFPESPNTDSGVSTISRASRMSYHDALLQRVEHPKTSCPAPRQPYPAAMLASLQNTQPPWLHTLILFTVLCMCYQSYLSNWLQCPLHISLGLYLIALTVIVGWL